VRRLRTLAGLPPERRALLVCATVLLIVARVLVACVPLARVVALAGRAGRWRRTSYETDAIGWAIAAAAARVGATCLPRALAARVLLGWSGRPSRLSLGFRRDADGVAFHAWTAADGIVLPERPDPAAFEAVAVWS
jgi:hypothetical protein